MQSRATISPPMAVTNRCGIRGWCSAVLASYEETAVVRRPVHPLQALAAKWAETHQAHQ